MVKVNAKTIHTVNHICLTTMTVLLVWQTQRFILTHATSTGPIATSKQKHPVIL